MKLSEAIRLGSMMKPQQFDKQVFFKDRGGVSLGGFLGLSTKAERCSCVMGAAIDGAGLDDDEIEGSRGWPEHWDFIFMPRRLCPQCGIRKDGYSVITHLNDHHKWSREEIADWVETIENEATRSEQEIRTVELGNVEVTT